MSKLIYENKEAKTSYYIAGYNSKSSLESATWYKHSQDILLKEKCYEGFFKKKFANSEFSLRYYIDREVPTYTFEQFKIDLLVLDNPKYVVIYAERPPRPPRVKSQEEIDSDNAAMIAACCVSTAFL